MAGTVHAGLRFRPRARLMSTLGSELISSDTVALAELVKNAYDAEAGFVLVRIAGDVGDDGAISPETGSISVLDDGHGMDAERIRGTWLEPATPFRRKGKAWSGGRRILGEKGIGRFAAAKLGRQMALTSKKSGSAEVRLSLDWRDFNDDDKYLDDIGLDLVEEGSSVFTPGGEAERSWRAQPDINLNASCRPSARRGTLITVTGLNSRWNRELVKDVRRSLSLLVTPFTDERGIADDFSILVDSPDGLGADRGLVASTSLLKHSDYSLSAEVEPDGSAVVLLTMKDGSEQELLLSLTNGDGGEGLRCGPFEVFLYAWDRDPASMQNFAQHFRGDRRQAKEALDAASGMSVYRDGFRVLPYGEAGNDWLGLDARRVQNPTMRLSNNQIVGYILIHRDANPALVDQSNREGLVESPALDDLRVTVRKLLNELEGKRYKLRQRRTNKPPPKLFAPVDLTPVKKAVSEELPEDTRIQGLLDEAQKDFDDRAKHIGEALSRYHRLATLGKLIDMVAHELTQPIFAIKQAATLGAQTLESVSDDGELFPRDPAEELKGRFRRIQQQAEAADTAVRRIEPFGGRQRGRPARHVLEDAIRNAVDLLSPQIAAAGAEVNPPDTAHEVSVDEAELQEILINLLDNSLYWLKKSGAERKRVDISVSRNGDSGLSIILDDSGPGVQEEYRDLIFEPYFTTKADGVGLGLTIAGEIVEDYYDGKLELLPPGRLGGACFKATLRKRVL